MSDKNLKEAVNKYVQDINSQLEISQTETKLYKTLQEEQKNKSEYIWGGFKVETLPTLNPSP